MAAQGIGAMREYFRQLTDAGVDHLYEAKLLIVGEAGAGKTTLSNLLIGAEHPSSGSISIDGYEITKLNQETKQFYRRKIGVIFQVL